MPTCQCLFSVSAHGQISDLARLSDHYAFVKPNDRRALDLMNAAAVEVMKELPDLCIAYGVSDEYRCVLPRFAVLHFSFRLSNIR